MPKVIFASTKDSDMFYAVRVPVVDPFFFVDTGKKQYVFLDHREYGVFAEQNKNPNIELVLSNPLIEEAEQLDEDSSIANKFALFVFREYGIAGEEVMVPVSFPLDTADFLREKGIKLTPQTPFWPERLKKSEEEIKAIQKSLHNTRAAFLLIEQILRDSIVDKDGFIRYNGEILTSEFLKKEVDRTLIGLDMMSQDGLIISCGSHAAIPHHSGTGPLQANKTIICDIFPRHRESGYCADMTRTYVKGKPSKEIQKMYEAVLASQEAGIKAARPGAVGHDVHEVCSKIFRDLGYDVGDKGFTHGTGHGLGLDIHEEPYVNAASHTILEPGHVITIEPGLYYPETGGVRLEDVVLITENGCENLTNYPKECLIP